MFCSVAELVELAKRKGEKISSAMIHKEMKFTVREKNRMMRQMQQNRTVMKKAIERGWNGVCAHSGLTNEDVVLLQEDIKKGEGLSGEIQHDTVSKVVDTNEIHAAMGDICATRMGRVLEAKTFGVSPENG